MKLAFAKRARRPVTSVVKAPNLPAQAVPGVYMLFVVDDRGVPSVGKRVDIKN